MVGGDLQQHVGPRALGKQHVAAGHGPAGDQGFINHRLQRRRQHGHGLAEQIGGAQSGQALGGFVAGEDGAGRADGDDAVRDAVKKCAGEIEVFAFKLPPVRPAHFRLH
jgi:hypothetical protein